MRFKFQSVLIHQPDALIAEPDQALTTVPNVVSEGDLPRTPAANSDLRWSNEIDRDFAEVAAAKFSSLALPNVRLETRPLAETSVQQFDAACALFHVLNYVSLESMDELARNLALRLAGRP